MLPQQYCLRWKYHHSNLQTMFSQLLDRGCFCDVTLACEGQIIRAHRVVLCACSTFFDTLLSNYATEPIIIMKDAKFADVKCLIEFMYKGEINVEHANLASLLKTAEDLKIKGLAEVSWREDEFDSTIPAEPEQKFHEGILPTTTTTATPPIPIIKDNIIQQNDGGINSIPQHRIPRMPLLTPIPSPTIHQQQQLLQQHQQQQPDNFGPKRKRGRPPLDDSYDIFNSPKLAFIKNTMGNGAANLINHQNNNINNINNINNNNNNNNIQSPFRDSPIVVENQISEDLPENLSPRNHNTKTVTGGGSSGNVAGDNSINSDVQQQITNDNANGDNDDNHEWTKTKPKKKQQQQQDDDDSETTTEDDKSQTNDTLLTVQKHNITTKNELLQSSNDDYDYYDQKSDTMLDDMDTTVQLTSAELEEWKDVIKMDAYLSRGRRPQFWEEPFTKRVMDAIKSKKLEMKKAAQILGVSYGTLYGRYRETYGCLKHPYRGSMMAINEIWSNKRMGNAIGNQQYYAKRLRGALATIRRCEEVLTVNPDGSNNYQEFPKIEIAQQNDINE